MAKLFNFFSGTNNKNGRGVSKKQAAIDKKLGFKFFFKLTSMRFNKISVSNLIFFLCNIPIFFLLFGIAGFLDDAVPTATDPLYATLYGIMQNETGPVVSAVYGAVGTLTELNVMSVYSQICVYIGYLLIFTLGISSIGLVYNLRNICKGEVVDTWRDYFSAIKKNFRQGIVLGILDIIICWFLVYDIFAYGANADDFVTLVLYYACIFFAIVFYFMRFYMYIQLVTCKMTIGKILKNSLLLVALGIKRNLCALLGTVATVFILFYAYILVPQFTLVLILLFAVAFINLIGVYAAYPVVNKYVIEPYYEEHPEERPEDPWERTEKVFTDRE